MEALLEKLGWKKFAGIIVIVTLVFLSMLLFSFQSFDENSAVKSPELDEEQSTETGQAPGIIREENAFKYTNEYYSISYPVQYGVVELSPNAPVLSSIELIDDITSNKIQIVVFDRAGNTVDSLSTPYQNENFQGEVLRQNGMVGYRFVGGFGDEHHQKVVLLQKGNSIIRVNLTYAGEKVAQIESDYDAIIAGLN